MNQIAPQAMAVMQRPPSEEEVAFARARDRAVFAMDVLRLPNGLYEKSQGKLEDLRCEAIEVLTEYLGVNNESKS